MKNYLVIEDNMRSNITDTRSNSSSSPVATTRMAQYWWERQRDVTRTQCQTRQDDVTSRCGGKL